MQETYEAMADGQLAELAEKEGAGLTPASFDILKQEFEKRGLNAGIIQAAEQKRQLKKNTDNIKIREGRGATILEESWQYALVEMKHGKTYEEIYADLLANGLEAQTALDITEGLEIKADKLVTQSKNQVTQGILSLSAGLSITIITFLNAINGGVYIVAVGSIFFGGIRLVNGLVGLGSYKKILKNCIDQRLRLEAAQTTYHEY
ncbi:MAG TPA: hypothetical protein VG738_12750 [Chitinophagaceae bacterium]|nr:hypothetical protein [Chitinophagaceae bacterium]